MSDTTVVKIHPAPSLDRVILLRHNSTGPAAMQVTDADVPISEAVNLFLDRVVANREVVAFVPLSLHRDKALAQGRALLTDDDEWRSFVEGYEALYSAAEQPLALPPA